MGTAEVYADMPATGGRPDIGTQPNWVAQWLLSQSSTAEAVMMANADASGGVPWHLIDENTGTLINSEDYPYFWRGPAQCRRIILVAAAGQWVADLREKRRSVGARPGAHARPELRSLFDYRQPLSTRAAAGRRQLCDYNSPVRIILRHPALDPTNPGNATFMGVASPHHQERAIAWGLREVAEAAYAHTGRRSAEELFFISAAERAMDGLVQYYITDNSMAQYGDLQGFLLGSEGAQDVPIVAPWQAGLHRDRPGGNRRDERAAGLDDAVQMLNYMTNFIAGLYTNGENGYAPANGAAYWLYLGPGNEDCLLRPGPSSRPGMLRIISSTRADMVSPRPIPSSMPSNII